MATKNLNLGIVPVSRGEFNSTTMYYKDNIVQYKRGSYQVISESPIIGVPPTNDKNIVNPGWKLFAGTLDAQDVVNQIKEQEAKSIQAVADREAEILAKSDAAELSFDNTGTSLSGTNVQDALKETGGKLFELGQEVTGVLQKNIVWSNGWITDNGSICDSTLSKFSQPFLLKAGETVTVRTKSTNITIIGTTNAESLSVGDKITPIQVTSPVEQFETYSYTAENDIHIVICVAWSDHSLSFYDGNSLPGQISTLIGPGIDAPITKEVVFADGYVSADGVITSSTLSQFSQPIMLRAGEKISYKCEGGYQNAVVKVKTNDTVTVGDQLDYINLITYPTPGREVDYIAFEDSYVIISIYKADYSLQFFDHTMSLSELQEAEEKAQTKLNSISKLNWLTVVTSGTFNANNSLQRFDVPTFRYWDNDGVHDIAAQTVSYDWRDDGYSWYALIVGDGGNVEMVANIDLSYNSSIIAIVVRGEGSPSVVKKFYGVADNLFIINEGELELYKDKLPLLVNSKKNGAFSALFFSDIHADTENMARLRSFIAANPSLLDCVINGGDTVANSIENSLAWYDAEVANIPVDVLTTVGNHDAWIFNGDTYSLANEEDVFNKITAPVVAAVKDIVNPTGKNRYYKDYGSVRVIVLDAMSNFYWDAAADTWFAGVLADAITNSKVVLCVSHAPFATSIATYGYANIAAFKVANKTGFFSYGGTTNAQNLDLDMHLETSAILAVKTFIDNGGFFAGWLTGHTHLDFFFETPDDTVAYGHQPLFTTETSNHNYGQVDCDKSKGDMRDALNYITIDTTLKVLKLCRLGINKDTMLRQKNVLVYDYESHKIMEAY